MSGGVKRQVVRDPLQGRPPGAVRQALRPPLSPAAAGAAGAGPLHDGYLPAGYPASTRQPGSGIRRLVGPPAGYPTFSSVFFPSFRPQN
jgi:hypothetical protein